MFCFLVSVKNKTIEVEREKLIELRNKLAEFFRGYKIPTIDVIELEDEDF